MSSLTEMDIDALFEDTRPTPTTFPFCSLPAELRNMVYEAHFSHHATLAIDLSTSGHIIPPAPVLTSRTMHAETLGYYKSQLSTLIWDPNTHIEAQISNFDPCALNKRLCALSEQFAVPKEELVRRTRVTFRLGGPNDVQNLLAWVDAHMDSPDTVPVFEQTDAQVPATSAFTDAHLLSGPISLVNVLRTLRYQEFGHYQGVVFLEYAEEMGFDVREKGSVEERVVQVVAKWHLSMMQQPGRVKTGRLFSRKRDRVERDRDEMAQLVYALCEGIL